MSSVRKVKLAVWLAFCAALHQLAFASSEQTVAYQLIYAGCTSFIVVMGLQQLRTVMLQGHKHD